MSDGNAAAGFAYIVEALIVVALVAFCWWTGKAILRLVAGMVADEIERRKK